MKNKRRFYGDPKKNSYMGWILLVACIGLSALFFRYSADEIQVEPILYSTMLKYIEDDAIKAVHIHDNQVYGQLKDGRRFETLVLPSEKLWNSLHEKNIDIKVIPQESGMWGNYIFFLLLLGIMIWAIFFFRQNQGNGNGAMGKIFNVGKSRARFFSPNTITVTFKDVAGVIEAKEELQDIVDFLKNPAKYERLGAKIPRGILLSGAPGNGKTMLAKAVAGEASCPFFSTSGSDFVEVFVGVGASRVRDLFLQARKHAPCIVFIDEIDAVGRQRGAGMGGGNDEREQTLNQLLAEMDGFSTEPGAVIVLAATNRPDVLDKALLRPGRFDKQVEVGYPDLKSRQQILEVHAKKAVVDKAVDLQKIAQGTPGFTGADLANLINEAAINASKRNHHSIDIVDFEKARDRLMLGSERSSLIITEKDRLKTAYHESGHTLLNLLLIETDPFHKVTVVPRGRTLGVSWSLPERDRTSESKGEMLARIMVCLGGYIVEQMVFGDLTSGASNDLEKANAIARAMVCRYGMSEMGPLVFDLQGEQSSMQYAESTLIKIDEQVVQILNQCLEKGKMLLEKNRDKLDLLATTLAEKETLSAQEVYTLLDIEPREMHSFRPDEIGEKNDEAEKLTQKNDENDIKS
jgi:cell division protease FtsH